MTTFALVAAGEVESQVPAAVWGLGALAILMALLIGTLMFGRGRPHS